MKFQDKFYPKILQDSLQDFRSDDLFCDVRLVVDGQEFQAHKLILAAASSYFRCMFNAGSSFVESKQEKVNLKGIDRDALSDILKFIYSSDIDVNDENVYVLMEAANFLQIHALRTFISFYLQSSITIENCLQVYIMASLHHYNDLATSALHFLLLHFSKIVERDEYLKLPFEILMEIVSSKLLDVASEETLYEVILKWVTADISSRAQYLEALVSKVELNFFSLEALNKIRNSPVTTPGLQQKVDGVINHITSSTSMVQSIIERDEKYNFHKSRHKFEKSVIFAIGGESSGMASQSVECYTVGYDKWRYIVPEHIVKGHETKHINVLPPMRCARYFAACASDTYNVYVIGGRNSTTFLDECEVFNVRTNQWNYFDRFPEKLFAGGAAFLEGELVVVGGHNEETPSDKVWKLDKLHKVWTRMPGLSVPRYHHCTVAVGGYLYVLGGFDSLQDQALHTCLRFDPGTNKWSSISSMRQGRAKFGCAAVDKYIYVFGGTTDDVDSIESVERYDTFNDEWTHQLPMLIGRHSFSVAVCDREIYCMGGSDGMHYLDTVEKFSLRSKRWHMERPLQISRLASAAAALLVPYSAPE